VAWIWKADDGSRVIVRAQDQQGRSLSLCGPTEAGPTLTLGLTYRWHGQYETHEKYGEQFAFSTFSACVPHDKRGVIAYLVSIADNVGEKRAERLWDLYGPLAIPTLRTNPEGVAQAGVMSLADAKEAAQTLHNEAAFESVKVDLLGLLAGRGFQLGRIIKECLRRWQARAPEVIRRNPYALLMHKFPSAGWKRVDRLYLDLGKPPAARKRQALCAVHHLRSSGDGHTWFAAAVVGNAITAAVPSGADPVAALRLAIRARLLARRREADGSVWLAEWNKAANEETIARSVRDLSLWTCLPLKLCGVEWPRRSLLATPSDTDMNA
jgi:hypothetical protein